MIRILLCENEKLESIYRDLIVPKLSNKFGESCWTLKLMLCRILANFVQNFIVTCIYLRVILLRIKSLIFRLKVNTALKRLF